VGFEVDILEREESYKRRVNRMLTLIGITVALAVAGGFYMLDRQEKATIEAEAQAEKSKRLEEIAKQRAAYSADSTSAYNRLADFMDKYKAEKAQGASLFLIKLPDGKSTSAFLTEVWDDYAEAVEPGIDEQAKLDLYRLRYVDAMNQTWANSQGKLVWHGDHRPNSILVPELKFKFTHVEMLKTTFPQVARAQETAGIRVLDVEEEDIDSIPVDSDSTATEDLGETAAAP
jgi:hypothetical protein